MSFLEKAAIGLAGFVCAGCFFFYEHNDEDTVAIFQVSDEDGIEETDRGRKGRASRALGKRTGLFGVACAILVVKSTRFGCRAPPRLYLPSRADPI